MGKLESFQPGAMLSVLGFRVGGHDGRGGHGMCGAIGREESIWGPEWVCPEGPKAGVTRSASCVLMSSVWLWCGSRYSSRALELGKQRFFPLGKNRTFGALFLH